MDVGGSMRAIGEGSGWGLAGLAGHGGNPAWLGRQNDAAMTMMRAMAIGILGLLCGCGTFLAGSVSNKQTEEQCRQVVNAMVEDIVGLKVSYAELADFSLTNPVVMGNLITEDRQVQELRIEYFHNFQYVGGKDKTLGNNQPNPGGCIINIQLFPDGGSWQGFRVDEYTRNVDRHSEKTGVRLQASIQTQNKDLAVRLERIIRDRFKALE